MEEVKLPKMLSDMEKMATGDTFLGGNNVSQNSKILLIDYYNIS